MNFVKGWFLSHYGAFKLTVQTMYQCAELCQVLDVCQSITFDKSLQQCKLNSITWDGDTLTTDVNFIYAEKTNIPVVSISRVCIFFFFRFVNFCLVFFVFFFLDLCRRASKRISVNVNGLIRYVCLFVWWCSTALSAIFQLYRCGQLYLWRTRRTPPTCHKSLTNYEIRYSII